MERSQSHENVVKDREDPDLEKIQRLLEWAELIHKDMGDFIGALDRLYMGIPKDGYLMSQMK